MVDPATGDLVGYLVDISPVGMMMIGKQALETGQVLLLQRMTPTVFEYVSHLEVVCAAVWCHKDVNLDYDATGLRFVLPLPETETVIQDLIEAYGFQD